MPLAELNDQLIPPDAPLKVSRTRQPNLDVEVQMNEKTNRNWLTHRKIICIVLLLLVAGYVYARPTLENWLDTELPALVEDQQPKTDNGSNSEAIPTDVSPNAKSPGNNSGPAESETGDAPSGLAKSNRSKFKLKQIDSNTFLSPAGLVYRQGPRGEHRIQHVMRHAKNDPKRDAHSVFDVTERDDVLMLIDDAYSLVKNNSKRVQKRRRGDRTELTIDMQKRIGYLGGRSGQRQGNPACRRLKLILEGKNVVTAYPYR